MTEYAVELTDAALTAITEHARYIAREGQAPMGAQRWLDKVWDAVDSLSRWPLRAPRAAEDAYVKLEVRQLLVGSHLLLFAVDEALRTVWVVGLRHGHRLPRPPDLPYDQDTLDGEATSTDG